MQRLQKNLEYQMTKTFIFRGTNTFGKIYSIYLRTRNGVDVYETYYDDKIIQSDNLVTAHAVAHGKQPKYSHRYQRIEG